MAKDFLEVTSAGKLSPNQAKQTAKPSATQPHFGGADQGLMLDHVLSHETGQLSGIFNTVQLSPDAIEQLSPEAVKLMSFTTFLRLMSPAFLILLWYNFWQSLNLFLAAPQKTWRDYRNFTVNTLITVGWTILYACNLTVIGTAFAQVAPYFLLFVLSLKALSGFVNCVENIYYFAATRDTQFLWEAAKELLGVVTYTFGLVLTILLGMELNHIDNNIHDGLNDIDNGGQDLIFDSLDSLNQVFTTFAPMIKGLIGMVFIRTVIDILDFTYKTNRETLRDTKHFSQTVNDALSEAYHHPLRRGIPLLFKGIGKIVSLPFLIFYPAISWIIEKAQFKAAHKTGSPPKDESAVMTNENAAEPPQKNTIAGNSVLVKCVSSNTETQVQPAAINSDKKIAENESKITQRFFTCGPKKEFNQKKRETIKHFRSLSDEAGTLLLKQKVPAR